MHRSFSKEPPPPPSIYPSGSKSTKDFVWRASPFLPPRKAYSRLFVSSHRVLTLRDGRCRGDNISTIGWYMPRRSEWLCRRKTCLIKYRAICHGSLWCDRERIILWISSSATCSPSASPPPLFLLSSSSPTSFSPPLSPPSRSWERIIPDPLLSPDPPPSRVVPPTCSSLVSFRRSRILRITRTTPVPFSLALQIYSRPRASPSKLHRGRGNIERAVVDHWWFYFDILIGKTSPLDLLEKKSKPILPFAACFSIYTVPLFRLVTNPLHKFRVADL